MCKLGSQIFSRSAILRGLAPIAQRLLSFPNLSPAFPNSPCSWTNRDLPTLVAKANVYMDKGGGRDTLFTARWDWSSARPRVARFGLSYFGRLYSDRTGAPHPVHRAVS